MDPNTNSFPFGSKVSSPLINLYHCHEVLSRGELSQVQCHAATAVNYISLFPYKSACLQHFVIVTGFCYRTGQWSGILSRTAGVQTGDPEHAVVSYEEEVGESACCINKQAEEAHGN